MAHSPLCSHERAVGRSCTRGHSGLTRRTLLAAGATSALMAGSGLSVFAQAPTERRVIDVHHHCFPPFIFKHRLRELIATTSRTEGIIDWTPEKSLADMDKGGVATAVLSCVGPGVWDGNVANSRAYARDYNDYSAELVKGHPGRFKFFAGIPLPDIEGCLKEIEYAIDTLHADGICLHTNYDDKYLGDKKFWPVYDEINRRGLVVYVHPQSLDCCRHLVPDLPEPFIEYPFATTRAIASLMYAGILSNHTDMKWIFSHGGGTVAFLADRMSNWAHDKSMQGRIPDGPPAALARLYFDTASVTNRNAWAALTSFTTVDRIMFGTDFPWGLSANCLAQLRKLESGADLEAVEFGTARKLIPSLKA